MTRQELIHTAYEEQAYNVINESVEQLGCIMSMQDQEDLILDAHEKAGKIVLRGVSLELN